MNVLICDDDASTRFVLRRILAQNLGWNVVESGDGVDALSQLSRRRFDLLLLDLEMPALSGFEVLEVLRESESLREIPVVIVSQERRPEVIMRLREQHVAGYLLKPIHAEQVADRLANLRLKPRVHTGQRGDISNLHLSRGAPSILVDGNLDYRQFFLAEAERFGPVRVAESAASAVAQFRKSPVDVVFIGTQLGVMNVETMVRKLREAAGDRPVRVVCIVNDAKAKEEADRLGCDDTMVRTMVPSVFTSEFSRFVKPSGPVAVLQQMLPEFKNAAMHSTDQVFGMMLGAETELLQEPATMSVALQSTITIELDERVAVAATVHVTEAFVDEVNRILLGHDSTDAERIAATSEMVSRAVRRLRAHASENGCKSVCTLPATVTHGTFQLLDDVGEERGFLLRFHRRESTALCALSLVVKLLDEE